MNDIIHNCWVLMGGCQKCKVKGTCTAVATGMWLDGNTIRWQVKPSYRVYIGSVMWLYPHLAEQHYKWYQLGETV